MAASYKLARDARKSDMTIEPLNPNQGGIIDKSEPEPHTESLIPPEKPGSPRSGMKFIPAPNPNKHVKAIPVHPDISRPNFSGVVKT